MGGLQRCVHHHHPFDLHSFRQSSGDLLALGVKYLPTLMSMANGGGGGGGGNAAIGSLLANGLGSMLAGGGGGGGAGGAGGGLRDGFLYKRHLPSFHLIS